MPYRKHTETCSFCKKSFDSTKKVQIFCSQPCAVKGYWSKNARTNCSVSGCKRKHSCKGLCNIHYMRLWSFGDVNTPYKVAKPGDGCLLKSGYKQITVNKKLITEHRHLMQQHLGRKLKRNEYVHHKNHNRSDNRLENLELMTASEHGKIHYLERQIRSNGQLI